MKLAIVATHPVQYQVPWFRALSATPEIDLRVYYGLIPTAEQQGVGFGLAFDWDIPMLDGYEWEVLPNRAKAPSLRGFRGSDTPEIADRLARNRPDVVLITGWQALPLTQAYAAAIRQRIPRVVRGESNALRQRAWWVRAGHRAFLSRYHACLAIGAANRDFYLEAGVSADRIFDGLYFVDNDRFRRDWMTQAQLRGTLRRNWSIPTGSTCFLYAGKLEEKKRVLDLLDACARLKSHNYNIHLLIAGDGELMPEARRIVAERGLPVTFTGFLNQTAIGAAYAAADCLVLPSDYGETWGLVVNEAMCSNLPAIVSNRVGCGPDLIVPGQTGFVFPFGDVEALAHTLIACASAPARLAAMGAEAWRRVQRYSVEGAVTGTVASAEFAIRYAAPRT